MGSGIVFPAINDIQAELHARSTQIALSVSLCEQATLHYVYPFADICLLLLSSYPGARHNPNRDLDVKVHRSAC